MADIADSGKPRDGASTKHRGPSKLQQLNKMYGLPAPLRTFPLPTFNPHNPVSLLQILYTWVSQTINPPTSHPETPFLGWYSPETCSIHVTDHRSIRALWEQGFYGKGSLSRSEPSWLDREKRRKGETASKTSEEVTSQRRAERQQLKWERARKEREAIDQTLLKERGISNEELPLPHPRSPPRRKSIPAPVGPLELLALPNSSIDLEFLAPRVASIGTLLPQKRLSPQTHNNPREAPAWLNGNGKPVLGPTNGDAGAVEQDPNFTEPYLQGNTYAPTGVLPPPSNGSTTSSGDCNNSDSTLTNGTAHSSDSTHAPEGLKRRKSVRFSPTVEQTTYFQSEPPSPDLAASLDHVEEAPHVIVDQEHLQLTMEEAFFLNYGLGVLTVYEPTTKKALSTRELFTMFRQASYFPPSELPLTMPDDPFMVSYVVYHHFRSLGWVVRGGVKFSVDYLLYNRGPVFSHAEFAVLIMPSYSDEFWTAEADMRDYVSGREKKSWSWLHCINRVNTQVKKTLVLVYVDIPPPLPAHVERDLGLDGILKRYTVREIVLKRWLSNRSRD